MDTINNDDNVNKDELALQMMFDDDDDAKSDDSFKKLMRENLKNKNDLKKNKETVVEEKEDELYEVLFKQNSVNENISKEELAKNR